MKFTIGQYYPADSMLHAFDPRFKLVVTAAFLCAFVIVDSMSRLAILAALSASTLLATRIRLAAVLAAVRPVLFLLALTMLIHACFTEDDVHYSFLMLSLSRNGLIEGFRVFIKLLGMLFMTLALTASTKPLDIAFGLERLFRPLAAFRLPVSEISLMITMAIRFIPTIFDEMDKITKAHKSRGVDLESGGFGKRVYDFAMILIPLLNACLERSEELAVSLESRCYSAGAARTRYRSLEIKRSDIRLFALFILGLAGAMSM